MTLLTYTVSIKVPDGTPDAACEALYLNLESRFETGVQAVIDAVPVPEGVMSVTVEVE